MTSNADELTKKKRITIVFIGVLGIFGLAVIKAAYLQIINREKLLKYSHSQIIREIKFYPDRGKILDRNGSPIAMNIKAYNLFVIPKLVLDKKVYSELEKIVPDFKHKNLAKKLLKKVKYTWIARKYRLNEEQANAIKKLKGVFIEESSIRVYPNNEVLSQVVGFVGQDNQGLSGVEYYFDKQLKGKPHTIRFVKDAKGTPLKTTSTESGDQSGDLNLSIDLEIQSSAEKFLKEAVIEHKASGGGVGVMNAETGEILAMTNYPNFNPNMPADFEHKNYKLSYIADPIEPGSIMKTITIAASIEAGLATPNKKYDCEGGKLRIGDHVISEAELHEKYQWISATDILKFSSNVGTTKIAFELGAPRLLYFYNKFGFGKKSEIECSGESRGIVPELNTINSLKLSNISFGQGIAVTPIQMLTAYSIIANGGYAISPTLVKKIVTEKERKIVISSKTVADITKMLVKAVEEGTGSNAKIPLFTIAGKTSTAQRVSELGGYKGYIPGFAGFSLNTPNKYVIYAYIDNPTSGGYYGNDIAAPVFKKLMEYILLKDKQYINVSEVKAGQNSSIVDSVVHNLSADSVNRKIMPNFIGLDKKSVFEVSQKYNLKIVHHGVGLVKKQSIGSGAEIESEKNLDIDLYYEPPTQE